MSTNMLKSLPIPTSPFICSWPMIIPPETNFGASSPFMEAETTLVHWNIHAYVTNYSLQDNLPEIQKYFLNFCNSCSGPRPSNFLADFVKSHSD